MLSSGNVAQAFSQPGPDNHLYHSSAIGEAVPGVRTSVCACDGRMHVSGKHAENCAVFGIGSFAVSDVP